MSETRDDGGALFRFRVADNAIEVESTLSPRDYFAAHLMHGLVEQLSPAEYRDLAEGIIAGRPMARVAYVLADAMLAERAK